MYVCSWLLSMNSYIVMASEKWSSKIRKYEEGMRTTSLRMPAEAQGQNGQRKFVRMSQLLCDHLCDLVQTIRKIENWTWDLQGFDEVRYIVAWVIPLYTDPHLIKYQKRWEGIREKKTDIFGFWKGIFLEKLTCVHSNIHDPCHPVGRTGVLFFWVESMWEDKDTSSKTKITCRKPWEDKISYSWPFLNTNSTWSSRVTVKIEI